MTWNIFQGLVEDFSHSDVYRLKILNAILLTELTIDYSDLDRLKYLNIILLSEFKNYIQRTDLNINNTQISKSKISTNTQIKIEEVETSVQKMENFENEHIVEEDQRFSTNDPTSEIEIEEKDIFDMSIQNIEIDHIRDDQNSINGFQDMNDELIRCEICEKVFKNKIMLKNHFCIVHNNEGEIITCNICTKTFQTKIELKSHIKCEKGFHKGLRTNKFDSGLSTLGKHLFTVHDGHKDFKCGKHFLMQAH